MPWSPTVDQWDKLTGEVKEGKNDLKIKEKEREKKGKTQSKGRTRKRAATVGFKMRFSPHIIKLFSNIVYAFHMA